MNNLPRNYTYFRVSVSYVTRCAKTGLFKPSTTPQTTTRQWLQNPS
jgi:hypothetical protein